MNALTALPRNFLQPATPRLTASQRVRRVLGAMALGVLSLNALWGAAPAQAQTALADQPLFTTSNIPGNLALALSVEFPTAISVAHRNRNYSPANEYLGYFDPDKCYIYNYSDGVSPNNYFYPAGLASSRSCSGKWSGNFLNWAAMQTIDTFRWALTGGFRRTDDLALTVVEKAWGTAQGSKSGNFPDSSIPSNFIAGATPFAATNRALQLRVWGLGNKMRFSVPGPDNSGATFTATYFNNKTLTAPAVLTRNETAIDYNISGTWPPGVNTTNLSARWVGTVTAPVAGTYVFRGRADDGIRIYVDGLNNVTGWRDQGATDYDLSVPGVAAGQVLNVTVEFYQGGGGGEVSLAWQPPGAPGFSVIGAGATASLDDATATHYNPASVFAGGVAYEAFVRAKVCDPAAAAGGLEANCVPYNGGNFKPEGLLQKYANKIRYSAFGYLNDSNILRDGGVLRARMKFVGPSQPVPGNVPINNLNAEWSAATGQFLTNPDSADAVNTRTIMGLSAGSDVVNSGVINYLNKFGSITPGSYKTYDNVSELYYAAIRYFKNLPAVPEWTSLGASSNATRVTWTDGFPVITAPVDPILYSCQRNFILGIGDTNTHADKNVPGNTQTTNEPPLPAAVSADTSVNAVTFTNKVGVLEGLGNSIGTTNPWGGCCSNNSALMAGLAYHSHTKDIRLDVAGQANTAGLQTIDTYWVDVWESGYATNNQFWLATKYGGFTVPLGYDADNNTTALPAASWSTNPDVYSGQRRPDNYFTGSRPDLMKAGLEAAFSRISSAISAFTTSFSTSLPQVALSGNSSFSSKYDGNNWTGEVTASNLSFDAATGQPSLVQSWNFTDVLAIQLAGTGWNTNRRIATWNGNAGVAFRTGSLASSDLAALDTNYTAGNDSSNFLNYLRGDRTHEVASTASGTTNAYRTRSKLLGDIVGSKSRPVSPPSFPFADSTNAGYSSFKTTWKNRRTVVYVGANDGMLHAINGALVTTAAGGLEADTAAGSEMFAYVPRGTFQGPSSPATPNDDGLAGLGKPTFTHRYYVNATPNAYDIDFGKTPGNAGAPDWRTVLIGGLGKGGRSYYALDITDPQSMVAGGESAVANKVLWEFNDSALGFTYGDPVVVKTKKYGWVVVFPSGYNNADGQGYFIFVNPRTGALLEKVATGLGSVSNSAGLAHANAFVTDASDGTADAIYAGDLLGNLWRLDVSQPTGAYPAPIRLTTLTDSVGNPQPVTSRPSIEIHPSTKKRFVMVGTGRLLDATDIASTRGQSFYAIWDGDNAGFNATLPGGQTFPFPRTKLVNNSNPIAGVTIDLNNDMGWYENLGNDAVTGIGWRVVSDSTTLLGSVAFAASLPNGSVCSPSGDSRIYARDFSVASSTVKSGSQAVAFLPVTGNVTDLRYLSVRGKPTLVSGTDTGSVAKVDIAPSTSLQIRRLNWRELQVVD